MTSSLYNEGEMITPLETYHEIENYIQVRQLDGADITLIIEDVHEHYEVASRFNWIHSKRCYRDILSRLVKNYGH